MSCDKTTRERLRKLAEQLKSSDPSDGNLEGVMAVAVLDLLDDDDDLPERVRRAVDERDRLFHVASEMLATILIERNRSMMPPELRQIADVSWRPQIEAVGAGRELTPDELAIALTTSGLDVSRAHDRLQVMLAEHKKKKSTPAPEALGVKAKELLR